MTASLTRSLRARQAAARCDQMAAAAAAKAARYPDGTALRADWAAIAAEYRATAADWRTHLAALAEPRRACTACPKRALPGRYECAEHDDELPDGVPADSNPLTPGGVR